MRRASFAEVVLCRLTSRSRATAIVGDLIEVAAQKKSSLLFWSSFARVALSLMWRPLLSFVTAFYVGLWLFGSFVTVADTTQARRYPPSAWEPAFAPLIFFASTSWAAAIYLASRYSPKDRTAQLAFGWACVVSATILFWWKPIILWLSVLLALLLICLSILDRRFRREGLAVLISLLFGSLLRFWAIVMGGLYQYYLGRHLGILWGSKEVQDHPSLGWVFLLATILMFWMTTAIWIRLHDWAVRTESQDALGNDAIIGE